MLVESLVAVVLAASPVVVEPSLASPEFQRVRVSEEVVRFANEHLAQELASRGVKVVTARQIGALLGLERQKQLLGCSDDATSCLTEMANALGTAGVLLGDLARFGKKIQLNLKVLRSTDGEVLARFSKRLPDEDELLPALSEAAEVLAKGLKEKLAPTPAPEVKTSGATTSVSVPVTPGGATQPTPAVTAQGPQSGGLRNWAWAPAVVGAVGLAGGVAFHVQAAGISSRLTGSGEQPGAEGATLRQQGKDAATWMVGGYAVAGVGLAAAAGMFLFGGEAPVQAAVLATPDGASVAVGGVWP